MLVTLLDLEVGCVSGCSFAASCNIRIVTTNQAGFRILLGLLKHQLLYTFLLVNVTGFKLYV
jgi:hypothetical protein